MRRGFFMKQYFALSALALLMGAAAFAQKNPCAVPGNNNEFFDIQTVRLWPGDAPQARGKACEDTPTLTILGPRDTHENGSAVIILPGGAYRNLAANHEGRQIADWFAAHGFRAFVLSYRLTSDGYVLPIPLLDARRAIQTVRARARDYKIDPNRIVVIGFSAGGHLAALAATQPIPGNPEAEDPIDRVSSRPDYLVLGYPWIGAISSDTSHLSYCKIFNLMDRCEALRAAYSPDLFVSKDTPPTFWFHTFEDNTVPVEQGLRFYQALIKAGVPSEAHIYAHGPHGFGLGKGDSVLEQWAGELETWLRAQGLMTPVAAVNSGDSHAVPFKEGVEISINGQGPYRFGLDTGSTPAFLIDSQLAHRLELPVTSQTHIHGSSDQANDPLADVLRIDTLQLAGHPFHHAIGVGFGNSSPLVKGGQGTLGMGLFKDVVLKIDYPGDRLSVVEGSLPEADGKQVLDYTEEHLHPILPIVLGGISVQAKLDSGARGIGVDLSVPTQFAAQLKLLNRQEGKGTLSDIVGHRFA